MADSPGSNAERKGFYVIGKPNLPGKLSHSLAIGKWVDLPATPDKVLKALGKA
jgi:hypothetical protein